jgi:predicted ATPase
MISRIEIKGYKSIKELEMKLEPINVLIGANGVGKSNFISFFKLINEIYEMRLENYSIKKGAESLLHFGKKNTPELYGYIEFKETNAYKISLEPNDNNALFIKKEEALFNGNKGVSFRENKWFSKQIGSNFRESKLKLTDGSIPKFVSDYLSSFKIYHFHDTSDSSKLRTPAMLNDNIFLREDGDNLASFLYFLQEKHSKNFKQIERVVKSIAPYFDKFSLTPDRINEERINLEWNEVGNEDFPFNAKHFSDGTIRFIALTTLLMQPNLPEIIIIDEPELGLHPVAINKLAGLIKKASHNSQIIISTQSVNLVNNFEPKHIITVDRINSHSKFEKLDSSNLENWLSNFSLGDLWLKNLIKGQPY